MCIYINTEYWPEHSFKMNDCMYQSECIISGQQIYQKAFSQLIMSIFIFFPIFSCIDFAYWKSVGLPHMAYIVIHQFRESVTEVLTLPIPMGDSRIESFNLSLT